MAGVIERKPHPLSVGTFRAWVESRPDEEHWELIDGVPVMRAPPTRRHQRIAFNLGRLLLDAFEETHDPTRTAYLGVGLDLEPYVANYYPQPDVAVVDARADDSERYSPWFYLAAEVVSESDRTTVDAKCEVYKRHPSCECVMIIRQDRCEVLIDLRSGDEWLKRVLTGPETELVLETFGLRCRVGDLYRDTALMAGR